MAPSSSSTRRAARLAQKGKGKRVRFQGGTLFPVIVAAVLVLGLALIVYARASRPAADSSPPQPNLDHWHGAFGFQICTDTPQIILSGNLEDRDTAGNYIHPDFVSTGVHSHDDGVIHWHPYGLRAAGHRAKLGVFFDNYNVQISNDKLVLPTGSADNPLSQLTWDPVSATPDLADFPLTYDEGEQQCNGKDATLKVVVWSDYQNPDSDQTYTANFDDIPFDRNGLVFTIAFVPDDVDVVMPTWAADLPRLGAADNGGVSAPGDSVPSSSEVPGSVVDSVAPGDTSDVGTTDVASTDAAATQDTSDSASTQPASTESSATDPTDTTDVPSTTEG